MTVSMQLTKRIYAGNGLTRQWEIDFPLYSTDDLQVFITSPQGVQTQVTTGFSVNTAGNILTYPTPQSGQEPLASGWTITLVRNTPPTQQIDLLRQGELDAEVLEQGYDKLTLITQELSEKIDRCIKYPVSTQPGSLDTDTFFNEVMSAKQSAINASSNAATAATSAALSAASATSTAQQAVNDIATAKQNATDSITAQAQTACQQVAQATTTAVSAAQTAQYYAQHTLGKMVGEVFYSQSSLATDNPGAFPLFTGETIANANQLYPEFYAWVNSHTELQISAANYETALTTYGECPKYVIDTNNKTIRLPLLKNYVKMANTTQGIIQSGAGLPNITGHCSEGPNATVDGAFSRYGAEISNAGGGGTTHIEYQGDFNASRSSAIYGASNTVTPSHTTLYPWVCAYNAVVPVSTVQVAQFQETLATKANTNLDNLTDTATVPVTNMLNDIYNTVQYSVVGSPTFNGGVVSGFSAANYLTLTKNPTIGAGDDFEISIGFVTPSTKYGTICGWYTNTNGGIKYLDYNALAAIITSSIELKLFGLMLDGEKKYTAKLARNNGVITFSVYEAGVLLQQTQTEFNGAIEFSNFVFFTLGKDYVDKYWTGSIDLTETYIKVNDKMWFIGRSQEVNPAHLAMPSDVIEDLTPTYGTLYTAPADGYVEAAATQTLQINILKSSAGEDSWPNIILNTALNFTSPRGYAPVAKGQKFAVYWNGTLEHCFFIYAQGTKHEKQGA